MAFIVQNTDLIGPGLQVDLGTSDDLLVTQGTTVASTDDNAVQGFGSSHSVFVDGTVTGFRGVWLGDDASLDSLNNVVVSSTGIVRAYSANVGVLIRSTDSVVRNHGQIESGTGWGIYFGVGSDNAFIENTGSITTDPGLASNWAIELRDTGGTNTIVNSGSILATNGNAIEASSAIGIDHVFNSGTIFGNVFLAGGADRFDGRGGTVSGAVFGGTDNDTYIVDDADILLIESGGEGTDTVQSEVNFNLLQHIENLVLIGGDDINGIGNGEDNNIDGNFSNNRLEGRAGNDVIDAIDGNDHLIGNQGNDSLFGGFGNDTLWGGRDDDTLNGGEGDDIINGGDGIDLADFAGALGAVTVELGPGTATGQGSDTLMRIENLRGSDFDDSLTGNTAGNQLSGGKANDFMSGKQGDDVFLGGSGGDTHWGGSGIDTMDYSNSGAVMVDLAAGTGTGGQANNDSYVGVENVIGTANDDDIFGDNLANELRGGGGGDFLKGNQGNDSLLGGLGDDTIWGGSGNDNLDGGAGNDEFLSGAGNDTFVFKPGYDTDTILNGAFDDGFDMVFLNGFAYANEAAALADFAQVGGDVHFTNGSDTLIIEGVTLNVNFTTADFFLG